MDLRPARRRGVLHHAFSTREFVPGHIAGTLILLFGTIAVAKHAIASAHDTDDKTSPGG